MKKIFLAFIIAFAFFSCKKDKTNTPAPVTPLQDHTLEFRVYNQPDSSYINYSACCSTPYSFNYTQVIDTTYFSYTKVIQKQSSAITYHIGATPYNYDTMIVQILLDGSIKAADTSMSGVAANWSY